MKTQTKIDKWVICDKEVTKFLTVSFDFMSDTPNFFWSPFSNSALTFNSEEEAVKYEENEAHNFLQFETSINSYVVFHNIQQYFEYL